MCFAAALAAAACCYCLLLILLPFLSPLLLQLPWLGLCITTSWSFTASRATTVPAATSNHKNLQTTAHLLIIGLSQNVTHITTCTMYQPSKKQNNPGK